MLLSYDEDRFKRLFVTQIASPSDLPKLLVEASGEIANHQPIRVEFWREATEQERREAIAQRRLAFFQS